MVKVLSAKLSASASVPQQQQQQQQIQPSTLSPKSESATLVSSVFRTGPIQREKSSLELLSDTAAWKNVIESEEGTTTITAITNNNNDNNNNVDNDNSNTANNIDTSNNSVSESSSVHSDTNLNHNSNESCSSARVTPQGYYKTCVSPERLRVYSFGINCSRSSTPCTTSTLYNNMESFASGTTQQSHHPQASSHQRESTHPSFDDASCTASTANVYLLNATSSFASPGTTGNHSHYSNHATDNGSYHQHRYPRGLTSFPSQASLPSFVSTHSGSGQQPLPTAFLPPRHGPIATAAALPSQHHSVTFESTEGSTNDGTNQANLNSTPREVLSNVSCAPFVNSEKKNEGAFTVGASSTSPFQHWQQQPSQSQDSGNVGPTMSDLMSENAYLKEQLHNKDQSLALLHDKIARLEAKVQDLRQLPTGKISQIPIEDMIQIMQEYGSEVSDVVMPPRKPTIQKASIVRQFRRWNPNFFEYFTCVRGKWMPKLGKQGELHRRMQTRRQAQMQKRKTATAELVHRNSSGLNSSDGSEYSVQSHHGHQQD